MFAGNILPHFIRCVAVGGETLLTDAQTGIHRHTHSNRHTYIHTQTQIQTHSYTDTHIHTERPWVLYTTDVLDYILYYSLVYVSVECLALHGRYGLLFGEYLELKHLEDI